MRSLAFIALLVSMLLTSTTGQSQGQKFEYSRQAEFDSQGNIYVSSDQGKLIWMADTKPRSLHSKPRHRQHAARTARQRRSPASYERTRIQQLPAHEVASVCPLLV
jgi:hypothetical protein